MTQFHDTTESRPGKHLSKKGRDQIEALNGQNLSNRQIAQVLNRAPQTINNEMKRGTVKQLKRQKQNGQRYDYYSDIYSPEAGQALYTAQRQYCGRPPKWSLSNTFVDWADTQMRDHDWSPDAVVGATKLMDAFPDAIIPSTPTLYGWIDCGIMRTKNIDLPEKLARQPKFKSARHRARKQDLGTSISERPEAVEDRQTFGHWEIDTVIGAQHKQDPVLLTLVERQTRFEVLIKIDSKDAASVTDAMQSLSDRIGTEMPTLFKSITADNGSEFSELYTQLNAVTAVYFAHPYASYERGTSENQHKLVRRFIPKHTAMADISDRQVQRIQRWMNDYPRKVLNYQTAHDSLAHALKQERAVA